MHSSSIGRGNVRVPLALALTSSFLCTSAGAQVAFAQRDAVPLTRPAAPEEPVAPPSDAEPLPANHRPVFDSSSDVVLYDTAADGALWARGELYKARFDGRSATIVPFFGSDAPQNYPLEFRVDAAALGARPLDATSCGYAAREGDVVRIDRGGFVEEYELTTKSVEQRFVFDQLAGSGDLVVRIDVATELAGSDQGATLRFENDLGRIEYWQAFALDATGRKLALDSTLVDGTIELRVPASFVEHAVLPLVIDPSSFVYPLSNSTKDDIQSDVSFDVTTDRWCYVWTNVWSQTDHDVYARLATGSELLLDVLTIDFTGEIWTTPKVANNGASNTFLVCAAVVPSSGVAEIRGRFVQPAAGTTGAPFNISPQDGVYRDWPDVGGDPYAGVAASYFCVVWQRYAGATDTDIEARLVRPDTQLGPVIPVEGTPELHELPTISNSTGIDVSGTEVAWTVAWQHPFSSFDHDIYGRQIRWDGVLVTPIFPIDTSAWDETNPVASTIAEPTAPGGPRTCLVAYERDYGDRDIIAAVVQGSTVLDRVDVIGKLPSSMWYHDQTAPAIDCDGSFFLLGFTDRDTATNEYDAVLSEFFWDGSTLGVCTPHWDIGAFPGRTELDYAIHSRASSGGPHGRYGTTWTASTASEGYDVVASYYDGCINMVETVCNADGTGPQCPCGNNGDYGHGCANSNNSHGGLLTFYGSASVSYDTANGGATLNAYHLPPNVPCLFFQGASLSAGVPFGNGLRCVTGNTLRIGFKPCSSNGDTSYPWQGDAPISVAGQVPAAGDTRYYQAWYRDPAANCTATFNVTNALRVIWTP